MPQVSDVLRQRPSGYGWWCPGCKSAHWVPVGRDNHPVWQFNGDPDCPTFAPSVRHFYPAQAADGDWPGRPEKTFCHYFIRKGQIEFQNDCTHELAGQTVPMTEISTVDPDYGWGD